MDTSTLDKQDIKLGICGEHGGDPLSVEFCHNIGLSYVSPFEYQSQDCC